jgi:hypothetical protein
MFLGAVGVGRCGGVLMRDVTTETVRERMNELGQRITTGRISLREEFELACLRELLALMKPRSAPVVAAHIVESVADVLQMLDEYPEDLVPVNRKSALIRELRSAVLEAASIERGKQ